MGITTFSKKLLDKVIEDYKPKNVGEYGSQNLYFDGESLPAPFANVYYEAKGIEYTCFDVSKENNCLHYDLTYLLPDEFTDKYSLVTDFGCTEHYGRDGKHHLEGFYNAWLNKHNMLKVGGVMVNENPLSGHWNLHGFNYYTEQFYKRIVEISDYKIIELGISCAMGNCETGKNVYAILEKTGEKFPTLSQFSNLDLRQS